MNLEEIKDSIIKRPIKDLTNNDIDLKAYNQIVSHWKKCGKKKLITLTNMSKYELNV